MPDFDLIVLGGGAAGVAAAIRAARLGAKVAVVEADKWGGLCLNRACVPTKLLCQAADRALAAGSVLDPALPWGQKKDLTDYFSLGTMGLLKSHGVALYPVAGHLAGPGKVQAGQDTLAARAVILAAGGEWARPGFAGDDLEEVVDTTGFLAQGLPPRRVLFLGAGPWQLELAQFVAASGGEAVVVEADRQLLPGWEADLAQRLRAVLNQGALRVLNQATVKSALKTKVGLEVNLAVKGQDQRLLVDQLVHVNRRPALARLGLAAVGLGELKVDERQATPVAGLFAVGEAAGAGWSHLAAAQGIAAAENALGGDSRVDPRLVPRVCFTRPQAASVGLSETEAEEAGHEVQTGEAPLAMNPMAMIQGASGGAVKVVADAKYGEVLGVHVMAPQANELIGLGVLALQLEATLADLARMVLPHPVLGESLTDAARDALGWAIYQPK